MNFSMIQSAFKSNNQKNMINYYIYMNDKVQPKAILQLSHGMCEYVARYEDFINFLTQHGYIVCANDHIGHGNSISKYEELGYFGENGDEALVEDLYTLTRIVKNKYKGLPVILMGHSMGSFIARCYLDKYSEEIDGCIISGTSGGNKFLPLAKKITKSNLKSYGPYHRSNFIKKMADIETVTKYKDSYKKDFDWLTRDKDIIDKYASDKKCNFSFTVNGYYTLFSLLERVSSKEWGQNIRKDLPIFIFSGDKDPVGNFGKGVKKVYDKLNALNIKDLQLKLYPEGRHEMLNELNKEEVYQDILSWLECRYKN